MLRNSGLPAFAVLGLCVALCASMLMSSALIAAEDGGTTASPARVEQLRCEYRNNPLGIDVARPRLSWIMVDARRGARQTAYQILVASDPEKLARNEGNLWDSGRVESSLTNQIQYDGRPK